MKKKKHRSNTFRFVSIGLILFSIVLFISLTSFKIFTDLVGFTNQEKKGVAYIIPDLPRTVEEVQSECSSGECVGICLSHLNTRMNHEPISDPGFLEDDVSLVYYRVKNNELVEPRIPKVRNNLIPLQENTELHQEVWNYFLALFPPEARPDLIQFVIYVSSTSDGMFDTTATDEWLLYYNLTAASDTSRLTEVLIHEYGHFLTLNKTQQNQHINEPCRQETVYRCPTADSYLNLFYEKFWQYIYREWYRANNDVLDPERALEKFYQKYSDRFINEYASTFIIEDIAESWTYFILAPNPTGNTEPEQKIKFFYDFPELVQLRYQIIKGICSYH